MSLTKANFRMIDGTAINIADYGAVGDDSTDDTAAIQAAATAALSASKALYIPSGTYKITSAIVISFGVVFGDGPSSVIKNYGTGDALDLSQCGYYSTFQNFSVDGSGNAASRDGISLYRVGAGTGNNVAYSHFNNVYSYNNGRHGFYHRQSWGTRYEQCKAHYNGGCGYYLYYPSGDAGGANGINFYQCDARHNGSASGTFSTDNGGIRIEGAAEVYWSGGIIESNEAWGVIIDSAFNGNSAIFFDNLYGEFNGYNASTGGFIYVGSLTSNVSVKNSWITYGANTGNTNYFLYNASTSDVQVSGNTVVVVGAGTSIQQLGITKQPIRPLTSIILGDVAASGSATTTTIFTATDNGHYVVSGVITGARTGVTNQHGYYPFVATRDNSGSRSVEIGATGVTALSSPPTMAWSGNDLQVTIPGFNYVTVTLNHYNSTSVSTKSIPISIFPQVSDGNDGNGVTSAFRER
jgi:hypothetical protein